MLEFIALCFLLAVAIGLLAYLAARHQHLHDRLASVELLLEDLSKKLPG